MKSWALGAMVLSMIAATACGSKETTSSSGDTGGSGGAGNGGATTGSNATSGSNTTATTGSNTTATGTTSTGAGGDPCADASDCTTCPTPSTSDNTCGKCCATSNPDAQKKFISLVVAGCICAPASPCFTVCGGMGTTAPPLCGNPTATVPPECNACVNGLMQTEACIKKATTDCLSDSVCKLLGACAADCAG